jgi:hypothetical protein
LQPYAPVKYVSFVTPSPSGVFSEGVTTILTLRAVKRLLVELRNNLLRTDFGSIYREGYAEDQEG